MQLYRSQLQKLGKVKESPGIAAHAMSVGIADVRMRGTATSDIVPDVRSNN